MKSGRGLMVSVFLFVAYLYPLGVGNILRVGKDGLSGQQWEYKQLAQTKTSNVCVTPFVTCYLAQYGPAGSPCWCATPSGPIKGRLG